MIYSMLDKGKHSKVILQKEWTQSDTTQDTFLHKELRKYNISDQVNFQTLDLS